MDELDGHPDLAALDRRFPALEPVAWFRAAYLAIHHPSLPLDFLWLLAQVPGTPKPPR